VPLLDLQRRMRELGRIRTGHQVEYQDKGKTKRRPAKLETFRLTSASKELIEHAAEIYGGEVAPWDSPSGRQWQLVTAADALDIVVPPGQAISQWWELWTGGGCERRCDGRTNVISDEPCACPQDPTERRDLAAEGKACKPTTRLNVILPALPDLGVWRLEVHGYYAATELAGTADFLALATARGVMIEARLRLEQRTKKVPGEATRKFAVPVIELPTTRIADLTGSGALPVLGQESQTALPPGPVNRRERVDRPALPQGAPLPTETTFAGNGSPGFGTRPELPGAKPIEKPAEDLPSTPPADPVTGEVIEDLSLDGGEAAKDDSIGPLTAQAFWSLVRRYEVPQAYIQQAGRALVKNGDLPADKTLNQLTDDERGLLAARIVEGLAPVTSS
jgi:hypothetical protein